MRCICMNKYPTHWDILSLFVRLSCNYNNKDIYLFTTTAVSNYSNHKLVSQEYLFKQFLKLLFLYGF